jgi:hypothetical protein
MKGTDANESLKHGPMERLRFIDSQLFWEARINRSDLIVAFAISPAQAALDLRAYQARAGEGVVYDNHAKSYVTTADYKPVFPHLDGQAKLLEFASCGDPLTTILPPLERALNASIAARVRRAARDSHRLLIDYQSFTRPRTSRRWIAPVRLVSDGERWHTRAWCFERHEWRDFVLARIQKIHAVEPVNELPTDDAWRQMVQVTLRPAANLSPAQVAAVEREFGMKKGLLQVRLPQAMLIYAKRRWGTDRPDARIEMTIEV